MTEKLTPREAVKIFFDMSLGRTPDENELELFEGQYLHGLTLKDIAVNISESDEAKRFRVSRMFESMTVQELLSNSTIVNSTLLVSSDDIMNTIAQLYEYSVNRHPIFREVYGHFSSLKHGSSLSNIFKSITTSEEATLAKSNVHNQKIESRDALYQVMKVLYKEILERHISDSEVDIWLSNHSNGVSISEIVLALSRSDEAVTVAANRNFSEWNPGKFIQLLFNVILKRGATPSEITYFREQIEAGQISSELILRQFFLHAARHLGSSSQNISFNDPKTAHIFGGSQRQITIDDWNKKFLEEESSIQKTGQADKPATKFRRFPFKPSSTPLVSIVTSLFKGGRFIETFMENMVAQSIFTDCELIIINANSPEDESTVIDKYRKSFSNILYKKLDSKIGIYEAWNMAVRVARGLYCTNANLDDCRRKDSMELQAAALDSLSFVDVVYQDVLYSFQENLPFSEIARCGFSTNLPIISRYNLMEFNSPHNGPMWRKRLHEEIGLFDASLQSAGDFDFWLRCHIAGKTFFKLNDPHVGYYVNPEGLSTKADTKGSLEADMLSLKYYDQIVSDNITRDNASFEALLKTWLPDSPPNVSRYAKFQLALRHLSVTSRGGAKS